MQRPTFRRLSAAAVLLLTGTSCATSATQPIVLEGPSRPLPSATLADADLAAFKETIAGLRGRPIVVNLWASWCGPCRVEAPLLERASATKNSEVQFLGVATRDQRQAAEAFIERFGVSYPNLLDDTGEIRRYLGLRGLPTTYIFDSEGRLVGEVIGGISEQSLAARLQDARSR